MTAHYILTIAENYHSDRVNTPDLVYEQTELPLLRRQGSGRSPVPEQEALPGAPNVDIHVDIGPNRPRRIIERLTDR
jgi:vanillate O-demethylase monooxygenase subunit